MSVLSTYSQRIKDIRDYHGRYPVRGRNALRFLLEACCLSLEVFLHRRLGIQYFTPPKAFVACIFPFICMILVNFGIEMRVSVKAWNLFFIRAFPIVELPQSWSQLWSDLSQAWRNLFTILYTDDVDRAANVMELAVLSYVVMANLRWIEQMWLERTGKGTHPRSSGDSFSIWNPIYYVAHVLHLRIDIVKQAAEPALCFFAAALLADHLESVADVAVIEQVQFVTVWLSLGGMLLMLKAFLENRDRSKAEYERRANIFDSKGFSVMDEMDEDDDNPPMTATMQRHH